MPYDEHLALRMRELTKSRSDIAEKHMFGGVCFFLNGNMLCGVEVGRYMFRVGRGQETDALGKPGASPLDLAGRPLGGFVRVTEEACEGDILADWLAMAETFVATLPPKKPKKK